MARWARTVGRPQSDRQDAIYGKAFYEHRSSNTRRAAAAVLELVAEQIGLASVIDIGCGTGTWLSEAAKLGSERVVGVEGDWVTGPMLDSQEIDLVTADLEEFDVNLNEKFDLAISLEVAEHLSEERGMQLVRELCVLSDHVLFSAAIPGQGGKGHKNEQWQSYWADLFAANGFAPVDLVRPRIWNDYTIPYWYRQNCLLYVKGQSPQVKMLDVVAPDRWSSAMQPGVKRRLRLALGLPSAIVRSVARRRRR